MTSALGLFRLVRASIALSPVADVAAGAALAVAGGAVANGPAIAWAALASLCLFFLGMSQNDLADREKDARLGRGRPIPTGAVAPGVARVVVVGSLVAAVGFAAASSRAALGVAAAIIVLISLYNLAPRHLGPLGPIALGSIRALNLTLGAAALSAPFFAVPAALVYFGYIVAVSIVARMEDGEVEATPSRVRRFVRIAALLAVASPVVVLVATRVGLWPAAAGVGVAAVQAWRLHGAFVAAMAAELAGPALPRLVGVGLSGIFLIDAAVVLAGGLIWPALILIGFFGVSRALVRRFPPS